MKHIFKIATICSISLLLFSFNPKETEFYVSCKGDDQSNGTKNAPFATLEKALKTIVGSRAEGDKSFVQINIEAGTYSISKTIDMAENLSNISIQAVNNEKVVFSGGVSILINLLESGSENHYNVDLKKAGITNYGELRNVGFARPYGIAWGEIFVNKKPMHLSRWPNKGMIPIGKVLDAGSVPRQDDFSNRGGIMEYDSARVNCWAKENDVWMSGYFMWGYADDMVKIANIDTIQKTIKTASPTLYGFGYDKPWRQWYGVNILAELDEAGEYYIDRKSGMLHFISTEKHIETLEFSVLEDPFINIDQAKNINISGITFECSRGLGIAMSNTENVTVENCVFRNLGSLGVTVGKGIEPFDDYRHEGTGKPKSGILGSFQQHLYSNTTFSREGGTNNKITGCEFYNLGAGGVSLGGGDRITLEAGNNIVENCKFYDVNRIEKSYRPAVDLTGVGNQIRHCEIYNTPSMAIYMHGNNHIVEYNYIHDVCLEVEDQGAIYYGRDPSELGIIIRYNYFENIPDHYRTCAVYQDDGAGGMTVSGNVFYKAGYWNVLIGGGSNNTYTNNIFIDNKFGIHIDNRMQNWAKSQLDKGGIFEKRMAAVNYKNSPYSIQYPYLLNYMDNAALPQYNRIEGNVFVKVENLIDGKMKWLEFGENNMETKKDVGFVDYKNRDFSLKSNSIVFKKIEEFKNIPFSEIGLYKK